MKARILVALVLISLMAINAHAGYQAPAQNYQQSSWING